MPPKRGIREAMRALERKYGDRIETSFEPAPAPAKKKPKKEQPAAKKEGEGEAKKKRTPKAKVDKSAVLLKRKPQKDQFVVLSMKDVDSTEHSEYVVDATFSKAVGACSMHCSCIHNQRKHKVCKHILFVVRSLFGCLDEVAFKKEVGYPKTWPLGSSQWLQNSQEVREKIEAGAPAASVCFHCGCGEGELASCQEKGCECRWHERCRSILIAHVGELAAGSKALCVEHRSKASVPVLRTEKEEEDAAPAPVQRQYDPNDF